MQPTFFIPHGGGPCFFMEWDPPGAWDGMAAFLKGLIVGLEKRPKALLVVSAHWEAAPVSITGGAAPELIFDYYGFPDHTYRLTWPAPGDPALATRVAAALHNGGIETRIDRDRGFDHGVFIPMMLSAPDADIPTVALSLHPDLEPGLHMAIGRALAPLREKGVLIVGSGMSYHDVSALMTGRGAPSASEFDAWLSEAVEGDPADRPRRLADWASAPSARRAHPREEHLAPIFVASGAAEGEPGRRVYGERVLGADISAFRFGS